MSSPSVVRKAVPADMDELWRLFRLMAHENALFQLSEPKIQYYLDRVLSPERLAVNDDGPRGVIGVIGSTGTLEGAIMLVISSPWYSEEPTMDDCVNFVDPDYRHTNHANELIDFAKSATDAIRQNHPTFRMVSGVVSTVRTASKVRLYARKMDFVGAFFMYPSPIVQNQSLSPRQRVNLITALAAG